MAIVKEKKKKVNLLFNFTRAGSYCSSSLLFCKLHSDVIHVIFKQVPCTNEKEKNVISRRWRKAESVKTKHGACRIMSRKTCCSRPPCLDLGQFTTIPHSRGVQRCHGQVGRHKAPHFHLCANHLCLAPAQGQWEAAPLVFSLEMTLQPLGDIWPLCIHALLAMLDQYPKLANTKRAANQFNPPTGFNASDLTKRTKILPQFPQWTW